MSKPWRALIGAMTIEIILTACSPAQQQQFLSQQQQFLSSLNNPVGGNVNGYPPSLIGSTTSNRINPSLEKVGLKNILPTYNSTHSAANQFPHVALTIVNAPVNWSSVGPGCWTLNATVWSNSTVSKKIGSFDWCSPEDQKIQIGIMADYDRPSTWDNIKYVTTQRTEGPVPPKTGLPDGREMTDAMLNSLSHGSAESYMLYTQTALGTMFANVKYEMGADVGKNKYDIRVWIVNVPK